jgi:dolichol-phosphate mannosyltransferase
VRFNYKFIEANVKENLVIIPTYNEKENIGKIIPVVMGLSVPFDILIIDDNSPDGTADIVTKLQSRFAGRLHLLSRSGKLGLGTAYISGFKWALTKEYKYIFEMDADFSHDPEDLIRLHRACASEDAYLAVGSRYVSGVNVVNWPMGRVLISYFASVYVKIITGMNIHDSTAGFVCYRREVLEIIDLDRIKFKGYAFQIEMKFTAWKFGFTIVEVPIIFTDRREGSSKMSGGIVNEAIWGVIKMKINSYFRSYKRDEHGRLSHKKRKNHQ